MRYVLNELAQTVPDWLMSVALPDWYERYGRRFDSFHLPDSRETRQALAQQIGEDGYSTHDACLCTWTHRHRSVRARCIEVLRKIWIQQYYVDAIGNGTRCYPASPATQLPPAEQANPLTL